MGHSLSATKRERQNVKRNRRNRENISELRREIKRIKAEVGAGKLDVPQALAAGYKAFDRAARKNAIPSKRADRKKARLALALRNLDKKPVAQP